MTGLRYFDLEPGEYTFVPSDWRTDVGQQLDNLTSGSEGDEPLWHIHDVEDADGNCRLEVLEDRRAMEGMLDTSGRQFLFWTPEGEPLMAFDRDGAQLGAPTTLRDLAAEEPLVTWERTSFTFGTWELRDADGGTVAKAKRKWSLGDLLYPLHVARTTGGSEILRLDFEQSGLFYEAEVTLDPAVSPVPRPVALAFAYGVFWANTQN